jgi:acyl transferase domain-containing protein
VITEALSNAGVSAETISYVETHGTGTPLGDPIEIQALTRAYRAYTSRTGYCAIGSVKSNVGHLDAAAGVTGLIKTALALKHRQLPPSLHFERPNPEIDFAGSPFFVNDRLRDWRRDGSPLRAGVSAFGVGGTNAHVILEEAPPRSPGSASREFQLLVLSARSRSALEAAGRNLARHLNARQESELADVAYTLQVGRRRMGHRRIVVCREAGEAVRELESPAPPHLYAAEPEGESPRPVYLFPGQGSQYVNMGRGLYEREKEFRRQVDWCSTVLRERSGLELRAILYPDRGRESEAAERLEETRITQPALFVVEYAMAKQLESWGIRAEAMIGHSLGEYVAACLSGVMKIEDALWLVSRRGELMSEASGGGMVAVMMTEEEAEERIGEKRLSIAAVNGPGQVVISGEEWEIEELSGRLKAEGKMFKRLKTRHAFHSWMMEEAAERYVEEVRKVELREGEIEYVSNVTGRRAGAEEMTEARYWGKQMRERVRFGEGVAELMRRPGVVLIEVGPGDVLTKLVRQSRGGGEPAVIESMRRGTDVGDDAEQVTRAIGRMWMRGVEIDWSRYYEGERRRRVGLPSYPFERQRYWIEARGGTERRNRNEENGGLKSPEEAPLEGAAGAIDRPVSFYSRPELPNEYVAPTNERESAIAAIWRSVLGVDRVGLDDNFFELGGDSLIAIQVISRLKEEFKVEIPVAGLYERLTIRLVDTLIGALKGEDGAAGEPEIDSADRSRRAHQRKRFQEGRRLKRSGGQTEAPEAAARQRIR